jgi:hypothetical protein
MASPMQRAMRSTSPGSKLAPQHNGDGKIVACQAARPVRHSSWTSAGMPCRPAAMIWRWVRASPRAPMPGSTGAVPNGRVSWPIPSRTTAGQSGAAACSCWCGATSPRAASSPTHTP